MTKPPEPDFAQDDLVRAIVEAFENIEVGEDGAFTTGDIARRTGMNERRVRQALHRLKDAGRLEITRTPRRTLADNVRLVEAYRLKPPGD
jgi:transcription initiation factor IIE alpha subunit